MSSTHLDYNLLTLIASIFLFACFELSPANEAAARALDLSWRPLYHSPHQQQLLKAYSSAPATSFISYTNLDSPHKAEIKEAAKHNAHLLKKLKELANQPITSYSDPYFYSQTPGPVKKSTPNAAFYVPNLATITNMLPSASSTIISRHPYPGKGMALYQTKISFSGKPEHHYHHNHNNIHQIISTTPKIEFARVSPHAYHLTPMVSTTRNLPIFSSSVTPHPVMNKLQAHLSLSPSSHSNLKIKQNLLFSPPSKVMSNYAMFGGATNKPQHWPNSQFHFINDNRPIHSHYHPGPEAQKQQQQMPEVHPSILTPFIEQVQLKQKEADQRKQQQQHHSVKIIVSEKEKDKHHHQPHRDQHRDQHHQHHHQQQNHQQQQQNHKQHQNHENFEMINDVFSKNLVPPPPSLKPAIFNHDAPQHKKKQQEKLNKFNLTMKSPLQDASRFNYENVVSTNRPSTPNVFVYLNNRTRDNVYKQHKQLHPSYKKKPFLPTPYEPEKNHEIVANGYEPQHAFFTVDDAVTPNLPPSFVENNKFRERIPVAEEIVENYHVKPTTSRSTSVSSTRTYETSTTEATPKSTSKPRQKLRRKKQKPKNQQNENNENQEQESINITAAPSRPKYKFVDANDETLKNRNRLNHPTRTRNRFSTQSPLPITLSFTSVDEKEKASIDVTPTSAHTSASTPSKSSEIADPNVSVKRRVKIKFRNKLRTTTSDPSEVAEFNSKNSDNQISESENENLEYHPKFAIESSTIPSTAAHSGLILPNLKFKNEFFTTFPTTAADSTLSSSSFFPSSTSSVESTVPSKIPRPRFSIKEIKRKQLAQSVLPTVATTTSTASTSTTLDSQRFNRFRASFNRRRNETAEVGEETEKKRLYPSRTSTTSTTTPTAIASSTSVTESLSTISIPRRSSLPKRTFPARNFTRPTVTESETFSTTVRPSRSTAGVTSSRGSFRAKLRKKEPIDENSSLHSTVDPLKNSNFNYDGVNTHETTFMSTSSTEAPYKHETSIMKIAKTPSTISKPSNIIENDLDHQLSFATPDNDLNVSPSEHMQRVVELTLSGNHQSHDFKSPNIGTLSRRIPNYFTISTDDPILPIQAFFPQINTNE